METLNVAGMVRNRRLAKALTDAAVGGFLRELEWECAKRGVLLLKAGLWFPSTQICARCGERPDARIDLSVRVYRCHLCGWQCDRDRNAALNLKQSRPCFMGDDKRTWRRCKSSLRAGDCQRSVYWTRQSLATRPASWVTGRLWLVTAIMPNPKACLHSDLTLPER